MNRDYTFRLLYDEDNGVYRTQCDELADVIDFACGKSYIETIEKQLLGMAVGTSQPPLRDWRACA